MEVIQGNIFNIIKLYPDDKDAILKLYKEDQNFQTMCDDYQQCALALDRWHESDSEKAPVRRKEYADLLQELELEIRQCLNEHA